MYLFSNQNGAKTLPDGAAHTHIAYIREYPPRAFIVIERSSGLLALRSLRTTDEFPVVVSLPPEGEKERQERRFLLVLAKCQKIIRAEDPPGICLKSVDYKDRVNIICHDVVRG